MNWKWITIGYWLFTSAMCKTAAELVFHKIVEGSEYVYKDRESGPPSDSIGRMHLLLYTVERLQIWESLILGWVLTPFFLLLYLVMIVLLRIFKFVDKKLAESESNPKGDK